MTKTGRCGYYEWVGCADWRAEKRISDAGPAGICATVVLLSLAEEFNPRAKPLTGREHKYSKEAS